MRRGTCPKCGAATVRAARNSLSAHSDHTTMWPHREERRRGMLRAFQGEMWQFACTSCGYLEWWVIDAATIQQIEGNWVPVPPAS